MWTVMSLLLWQANSLGESSGVFMVLHPDRRRYPCLGTAPSASLPMIPRCGPTSRNKRILLPYSAGGGVLGA